MSSLLNKRLARSLWRTKLRLFAVIFMVSVGVFAGLTFGGYSHNLSGMYDTMHEDDELGANLADLWIDNRSTTWSAEEVAEFCDDLATSWDYEEFGLDSCEGRNIVPGAMFYNKRMKTRSLIHFGTVSLQMLIQIEFGCLKDTPTDAWQYLPMRL